MPLRLDLGSAASERFPDDGMPCNRNRDTQPRWKAPGRANAEASLRGCAVGNADRYWQANVADPQWQTQANAVVLNDEAQTLCPNLKLAATGKRHRAVGCRDREPLVVLIRRRERFIDRFRVEFMILSSHDIILLSCEVIENGRDDAFAGPQSASAIDRKSVV